jgi:hypothetical protein
LPGALLVCVLLYASSGIGVDLGFFVIFFSIFFRAISGSSLSDNLLLDILLFGILVRALSRTFIPDVAIFAVVSIISVEPLAAVLIVFLLVSPTA